MAYLQGHLPHAVSNMGPSLKDTDVYKSCVRTPVEASWTKIMPLILVKTKTNQKT